jgi:hypothetical protein
VDRITAPLLNYLHIALLNQPAFDTPHLFQFIARIPKFQQPNEARITFDNYGVDITRPSLTRDRQSEGLRLSILRKSLVDQLSCLPQVCSGSLPAIVAVEHLYICMRLPYPQIRRRDNAEVNQWLAILRLFASEESLPIHETYTTHSCRSTADCRDDKNVTRPAEYFFAGVPTLWTLPQRYWAVRFRTTALKPPHGHFPLGQRR